MESAQLKKYSDSIKNVVTVAVICAAFAAVAAETSPRLRGFTTGSLKTENLTAMRRDWNANAVRLMLRPDFYAQVKRLPSYRDGWKALMKELPAYLDEAKKLGVAVIIDLHGVPNDNRKKYDKDRKKNSGQFWADRDNLKTMIACWREIATMCKDRDQTIWYDLFNEPLDWNDMPSFPKRWPAWAQQITDAIRAIDPRHEIVIEPGPGGLCWGFKNFPPLKGTKIIYSAHNYQPHEYTHQGISALQNTDLAQAYLKTNRPWPARYGDAGGGLWDKARLVKELQPVIDFQKKYGVRIYIGEFGVARWAPNAPDYLRDNLAIYEQHGWDWTEHAFRESPVWSPEHEPLFKENVKAEKPTATAQVLREYLDKNVKSE